MSECNCNDIIIEIPTENIVIEMPPDGKDGTDGNGIADIVLLSEVGLVKTYRINYTDGSHFDYTVTDGEPGTTDYNDLINKPDLGTMASVNDAPSDGKEYARKNGEWSEVPGGITSVDWDDINNKPDFGDLALQDTVDYGTDVTNKPTLGNLSALDSIDYTSNYLTNKPELGDLASKDTVNYETEVTNKPDLGTMAFEDASNYYDKDDLADALDSKAPAIVTSASGLVAHTTDAVAGNAVGLSVNVEPVQDLHGYDNPWSAGGGKNLFDICPISGHDTATVTRTGKNLFRFDPVTDSDTVAGLSFSHTETAFTLSGTANSTYKVFAQKYHKIPSGQYIWSVTYTGTNPRSIFTITFRKNGEDVAKAQANSTASTPYATLTVPEVYDEIRFTIEGLTNGSSYNMTAYVQLEFGSTATSYEPYQGEQVTIDLDGTRYGGVVDVTNGMLTVDRKMVDLGTLTWTHGGSASDISWRTNDLDSIVKLPTSDSYPIGAICSMCKEVSYNSAYNGNIGTFGFASTGRLLMCTGDENNFPSGQLVYPLAEPITYTLTPAQLSLLQGENNVWADTGDVSVTYRADTRRYIDSKLADLKAELQALILEH